MNFLSLDLLLTAFPAASCLFFLVQCSRIAITAKPIVLSSRRHFSFIAIPVMVMVGVSMYKITVIPGYIPERVYFVIAAVFFAVCAGVILKRGDWYYMFAADKKALFKVLRQSLLGWGIHFEENKAPEGEGSEHLTEFVLEDVPARLRVSVYQGQDMAQIGAVPSDNRLLGCLMSDLKKQAAQLGGSRGVSGFLITACILSGLAAYWTYTNIHSMDDAWFAEKGRTYLEMKKHHAAIATFNAALEKNPRNIAALRWRGKTYEETGREDLALADWQKALDLDPNNSDIMAHAARILFLSREQGQKSRAMRLARKAVSLQPDNVFVLDTLAWILAGMGEFEEAAEHQEKVLVILGRKKADSALMQRVTARLNAYKLGKPAPAQP